MNMMEQAEIKELRVMNKELKQTIETQKEVITGLIERNSELSDKLAFAEGKTYTQQVGLE